MLLVIIVGGLVSKGALDRDWVEWRILLPGVCVGVSGISIDYFTLFDVGFSQGLYCFL